MEIKNAVNVLLRFGEKIDVTDPCYDDDVWCRLSVAIDPGEYLGTAEFDGNKKVTQLQIRKIGSSINNWRRVGEVGVDSGLAGFFDNKPNFTKEEWERFCRHLYGIDVWKGTFDGREGFFARSRGGDGDFPVYVGLNEKKKPIACRIDF